MKPVNNVAKTNEQYISELQDGKICGENLYQTPYPNLFILVETKNEKYSYRDDDGDMIYSTRTIIVRKAFIKYEDEKYSFLINNWFDDIDDFALGLYAKVQLGGFYNLVNPLGEYLFSEWFAKVDLYGNNLFCCYVSSSVTKSNLYKFRPVPCSACSIYDKRGKLLIEDVIVETPFICGKSVISKDGVFNYIDENGKLLRDMWLSDAKAFVMFFNGKNIITNAIAKTETGWGILDGNGDFIVSPQATSIRRALPNSIGWFIIEDDKGMNLLRVNLNEAPIYTYYFNDSVESIVFLGRYDAMLVKQRGMWSIYKNFANLKKTVDLGELDNVGNELYTIGYWEYRILEKDNLFNVVCYEGLVFKEWYSEIVRVGDLFKVKRIVDDSKIGVNIGEDSDVIINKFEYNLAKSDGEFLMDDWSSGMEITQYQDKFLININPILTKNYTLGVGYKREKVTKVQGLCNIISGTHFLFKEWYDSFDLVEGEIFTKGYLKVWKDCKCNLIDECDDYVSSEWMDDFLLNDYWSYRSDLKKGAFEVVKEGRMNLLYGGKLLFDQWFYTISRHTPCRYDSQSEQEVYDVESGKGLYYLNYGLVGGRLYDSISRISDKLFFSIFDGLGHIMLRSGKIITSAPITKVYPFMGGYAAISNEDKCHYHEEEIRYNYINSSGKLVSPIWFEGYPHEKYCNSENGNDELPLFRWVRKNSKYNLITPDVKLVFNKWYDRIDGSENRWLVSDSDRGELKFNFIDNNEQPLSDIWFKEIEILKYLDDGIYAVKDASDRWNIFNNHNEFTLSKWIHGYFLADDHSELMVAVEEICNVGKYYDYYLDHRGYKITDYPSCEINFKYESYVEILSETYSFCGVSEPLRIIPLRHDGGSMDILCKGDGTPFFKEYCKESIFGSIKDFRMPDGQVFLLVDKHWPVKTKEDIGRYVIINNEGKELSEEFESISEYDKKGYAVVKRNGLCNLIDKDFHLVSSLWFNNLGYEYKSIETEYIDDIDDETGMVESSPYQVKKICRDTSFHNGYLKVELAGLFNLMNEAGKLQFPIWYDSLTVLDYGFCKVRLNGLFNIVNASNEIVSDIWFDKMGICKSDYDETIYGGQKGELHRLVFISKSSAFLSEDWFDKVFRYDKLNHYYPVCLKGKKNFVTNEGKLLVSGWHDDQCLFSDYNGRDWGVYVVVQDGEKFNIYSSRQSKFISDAGFDNVIRSRFGLFRCGWCGVQIDGKYTFVNKEGILAEGRFDSIRDFDYGFAGVTLDGKKNYLTSDGRLLSTVWFEEISSFLSCGRAVVKINGKLNIIDSTGSLLLSDDIQNISSIGPIKSDYCILVLDAGNGKTLERFYDFETAHIHDSERLVKDYLEVLKAESDKEKIDSTIEETDGDNFDANPVVEKRNKQIRQLIETTGKTGINYTLISFGNKLNLVDKTGTLVFEEWIDPSSIQMSQGIPLMMNADHKWIIVK